MKSTINISCEKAQLKEIRDFVSTSLSERLLDEVELNNLILAVDEVCSNLIIHSHDCNPNETFELSINIKTNRQIIFEIRDEDTGFDISKYKEPSMEQIIKEKRKGGLGLILVRKIMDDVQFKSESGFCVCRLIKNI